ncbi:MAG: helix-turn-helix transcriptional regulator [Candidatus Peribacter sp.]|jgi:transcriptional regulator with XRE-family HTH domain
MDNQHAKNLIGKRIKDRREALGISQLDLAKQAEKRSATYIALIENGERNVSMADLIKIAKALGVSLSDLADDGVSPSMAAPDINYALKADKDLSNDDRDTLLHIIDTMKKVRKENHDPL